MPYNPNPPAPPNFAHQNANLNDWQGAPTGKWFIGVIDTQNVQIYLVPVNPFEGHGALDQRVLDNQHPRAMNRYASGVAADQNGAAQVFQTLGVNNWLETRPNGITHHTGVATHYGANPDECLGFTLIKLTPGGDFAQLKCSSNSLNTKPGHTINHNFSQATFAPLPPAGPGQPPPMNPGSAQMPAAWKDAVVTYLKGAPFNITNIAESND
jgi:hypothetical protein